MAEPREPVAMQYDDAGQQREANLVGMWLFLGTEVMLFGGLFFAIAVYRVIHPGAAAEVSDHLNLWLGSINTAVLLTSSLTMALAVAAARAGRRTLAVRLLAATGGLGVVFLAVKGAEYLLEYREGLIPGVGASVPLENPAAELFLNVYFLSTGVHATHLLIGIAIVAAVAARTLRGGLAVPERQMVVEATGLYWHFVDLVWILLFPVLYLA